MKRLRVRGDWSDTGPNSRPETEIGGEVVIVIMKLCSLLSGSRAYTAYKVIKLSCIAKWGRMRRKREMYGKTSIIIAINILKYILTMF